MKAIFIDAKNREVKEVALPTNNTLRAMYELLGENCSLVEGILYLNNFDMLYGDEEAYYNGYEHGFVLDNYGYIHGNAIIMGSDANGENVSVDPYLLSQIKNKIQFAEPKLVNYMVNKVQNTPFTITTF